MLCMRQPLMAFHLMSMPGPLPWPMKVSHDCFGSLTANAQDFADEVWPTCTDNATDMSQSESQPALDVGPQDSTDITDSTDADIYKELTHNSESGATYPTQVTPETPSTDQSQNVKMDPPPPVPPTPQMCPEGGDRQPIPTLVVDHFTFSNAGTPVCSVGQLLPLLQRC